jgi:hypothetical protein
MYHNHMLLHSPLQWWHYLFTFTLHILKYLEIFKKHVLKFAVFFVEHDILLRAVNETCEVVSLMVNDMKC